MIHTAYTALKHFLPLSVRGQCNPWLIGVVGLKDTLPAKLGRLLESEFKHRWVLAPHLLLLLRLLLLLLLLRMNTTDVAVLRQLLVLHCNSGSSAESLRCTVQVPAAVGHLSKPAAAQDAQPAVVSAVQCSAVQCSAVQCSAVAWCSQASQAECLGTQRSLQACWHQNPRCPHLLPLMCREGDVTMVLPVFGKNRFSGYSASWLAYSPCSSAVAICRRLTWPEAGQSAGEPALPLLLVSRMCPPPHFAHACCCSFPSKEGSVELCSERYPPGDEGGPARSVGQAACHPGKAVGGAACLALPTTAALSAAINASVPCSECASGCAALQSACAIEACIDELLQQVTRQMRQQLRRERAAARVGGWVGAAAFCRAGVS